KIFFDTKMISFAGVLHQFHEVDIGAAKMPDDRKPLSLLLRPRITSINGRKGKPTMQAFSTHNGNVSSASFIKNVPHKRFCLIVVINEHCLACNTVGLYKFLILVDHTFEF